MKVWLTTDTHFGHKRMVEFGRPEDHSERQLKYLVSEVKPGDMLIHLGDFCIGNDQFWMEDFVNATPDVKRILVRGNHDHRSNSWYIDHGFHFVCHLFADTYFGKRILFTHIPWIKTNGFDFNIHGHLHTQDHRLSETADYYDPKYNLKLAVEETDYKPVTLESFITNKSVSNS